MSRTQNADTLLAKEKEFKKELKNFERFSSAIKMQYSFKKLQTFEDLLRACGFDDSYISRYFVSERSRRLTFKDVQDYLDDLRIEITTRQWLTMNPPVITYDETRGEADIPHRMPDTQTHTQTSGTGNQMLPDNVSISKNVEQIPGKLTKIEPEKEQEEPFENSPNESKEIFFFWFQKRAINNLMKGILGE